MKNSKKNRIIAGLVVFLTFCFYSIEVAFTCAQVPTYRPIYMSYDELRDSVKSLPPQPMTEPGKIMLNGDFIFVSERSRGIHIIDNQDPSNPETIRFINVPGNLDLAMTGTILYADSYVDLVAIDVSSPELVVETSRITNVYPNTPAFDDDYFEWSEPIDTNKGVIIGREPVANDNNPCAEWRGSGSRYGCGSGEDIALAAAESSDNGQADGKTGSLARITTANEYLYLLSGLALKAVSLAIPQTPEVVSSTHVGNDVETLYTYQSSLFIGGQTGVQFFDISDPAFPKPISTFSHSWQCDPIVVDGDKAYVTLRSGAACGGILNQLDILDIRNLEEPKLIKSYPMENPFGLAVDSTTLFLADGYAGLKVFDVYNPLKIKKIEQFPERHAKDVILNDPLAIVVGESGLVQYNYSDLTDIYFVSEIKVE